MELNKFSDQYKSNLDITKAQYDEGLDALHLLEKVLLQNQSFAQYDFNASGNRLQTMRRRVCKELNSALNELRSGVSELVRRRDAQLRAIGESLDVAVCELEMRKEMLDPAAIRYVQRVRELESARDRLEGEIAELNEHLAKHEAGCLDLLRKHLPDQDLEDVTETLRVRDLQSREKIADMRQSILASREANSSEANVVDAKSQVIRGKQTGAPVAFPAAPSTAGTSNSNASRSTVIAASRQRSSRVTSVRDEINKSLEGPYASKTGTKSGTATAPVTTRTYSDDEETPVGAVPTKRPVRVIGSVPVVASVVDAPDGTL